MSRFGDPTHIIKSDILPVQWAGWKSSTYELQSCGWQFALHENAARFNYTFVMYHDGMRLYGLFERYQLPGNFGIAEMDPKMTWRDYPPLIVRSIANDVQIKQVMMDQVWSREKIHTLDMAPDVQEYKVTSLKDLIPFTVRVPDENTQQVVIENQADMAVVDHLQRILDKQRQTQDEIFERNKVRERIEEIEVKEQKVKFQVVA